MLTELKRLLKRMLNREGAEERVEVEVVGPVDRERTEVREEGAERGPKRNAGKEGLGRVGGKEKGKGEEKEKERTEERGGELREGPVDNAKDIEVQMRELVSGEKKLFEEVEREYDAQVEVMAYAKHAQADRLMERLERMCRHQERTVALTQKQKPRGVFSLWRTDAWEKRIRGEEKRLSSLMRRRHRVRRIRDDMDETFRLGAAKLRRADPGLADLRDEAVSERYKQRSRELDLEREREREVVRTVSRGRSIAKELL